MGRTILASALSVFFLAVPAFAADAASEVTDKTVTISPGSTQPTLMASIAAEAASVPPAAASVAAPGPFDWWNKQRGSRPALLPGLYVGSALLQAYDAYSTMKALSMGGREANPMMQGATSNPVAFVAVKAAVTAASIMSAERMWKDHHRTGAVVTMVVSNGFMAWVAAHNASVVSGLQR